MSRTGGRGDPRCPGCKGRRRNDRNDKLAVPVPRNNHCCPRKSTKPMAIRKGSVSGCAVQLAATSCMWLFKTVKIKDNEKFSSLVTLGALPVLSSHLYGCCIRRRKCRALPWAQKVLLGLRGSRQGCFNGTECESLTNL